MNNPNENVHTYMTMSLVEQHTLRIDDIVARYGWVNDMARAPDKKTGEFHRYSVKGPAVSYAGIPAYWVFEKLAPHFKHPVPTKLADRTILQTIRRISLSLSLAKPRA